MSEFRAIPKDEFIHCTTTEEVYGFVRDYRRREGFAPSIREIAEGCGIGLATVVYHLKRLGKWGFIKRAPGKARSLLLVEASQREDAPFSRRKYRRNRDGAARSRQGTQRAANTGVVDEEMPG